MTPVGFEPTISAGELPKTYALDRAATGTGTQVYTTSGYWNTVNYELQGMWKEMAVTYSYVMRDFA